MSKKTIIDDRIEIRIDSATKKRLVRVAESRGINKVSTLVRMMIVEALDSKKLGARMAAVSVILSNVGLSTLFFLSYPKG